MSNLGTQRIILSDIKSISTALGVVSALKVSGQSPMLDPKKGTVPLSWYGPAPQKRRVRDLKSRCEQ